MEEREWEGGEQREGGRGRERGREGEGREGRGREREKGRGEKLKVLDWTQGEIAGNTR